MIVMTGASGFLGSHVHELFVRTGDSVHRIGRHAADTEVDLLRGEPPWDRIPPADVLVHCAGVMAGDAASVHASATMGLNVLRSLPGNVTRVVLVSSAYVHAPSITNVTEDVPPKPSDVYGHTKVMVEALFRAACKATARALVILRPCAIYGPGDPHQKAITKFIADAHAGKPPALSGPIHSARDYVHVDDAARAVCMAGAAELSASTAEARVFNVCTGTAWSAAEIARMIGELRPGLRAPIDAAPQDPLGYRFDPTRAARDLGFRAEIDLRSALSSLLGEP